MSLAYRYCFYRTTLCVRAVFAIARRLSVCLSIRPAVTCDVAGFYPDGWGYCQTSFPAL